MLRLGLRACPMTEACIHPNKHYPALGYIDLHPTLQYCLPQVSVEARSAQVCAWHALHRTLWHLLNGHVALGEGMTEIGLFPGHRNWMPRCSVKTTAFKQNRHIKPKQTSLAANGRQGSSRMRVQSCQTKLGRQTHCLQIQLCHRLLSPFGWLRATVPWGE